MISFGDFQGLCTTRTSVWNQDQPGARAKETTCLLFKLTPFISCVGVFVCVCTTLYAASATQFSHSEPPPHSDLQPLYSLESPISLIGALLLMLRSSYTYSNYVQRIPIQHYISTSFLSFANFPILRFSHFSQFSRARLRPILQVKLCRRLSTSHHIRCPPRRRLILINQIYYEPLPYLYRLGTVTVNSRVLNLLQISDQMHLLLGSRTQHSTRLNLEQPGPKWTQGL